MRSSQFFFFHNTSSPNFFSIKKHEIITATPRNQRLATPICNNRRILFATTDGFCFAVYDNRQQAISAVPSRWVQPGLRVFLFLSFLFCPIWYSVKIKDRSSVCFREVAWPQKIENLLLDCFKASTSGITNFIKEAETNVLFFVGKATLKPKLEIEAEPNIADW